VQEKQNKVKKEKLTYLCIYRNCQKGYKSSLALNLHVKMKHNGSRIREREAYAVILI